MSRNAEYEVIQINEQLIGATITEAVLTQDGESFGLKCEKDGQQYLVWVDSDQEGNGCGALKIEEFMEESTEN